MKKFAVNALIVLVLAFIIQWMFIRYVPNVVYRIAVHRSGETGNQWIHAGRTDAKMRRVVLPNPDFVYSALFYDIRESELEVSGVLPDSGYASVSFYDDRCQPYYIYNNLSAHSTGKFHFKLSMKPSNSANEIHAKTNRGVLICRYLVKGDSSYQRMKDYQRRLSCDMKQQ
jgi:uncharacterized membrane protein